MLDPMPHLVRQLKLQISLLEQDNHRIQRQVDALHIQLKRCVSIIEALSNHSHK